MATKPGKFDPDMLRERDLFAHDERHEPNWMDSADHLLTLRQWHRQLSEEIVATNRELAQLGVRNGGDSSAKIGAGKFRPLRPLQPAYRALFSVFCADPIYSGPCP